MYNVHRGLGDNISIKDAIWVAETAKPGEVAFFEKYITARKASEESGFSQEFSCYTKDGRIKTVWVNGRQYLRAVDVDRELKVPAEWWSLEATVKYTDSHPDYLRRLVREREIVGKTVHKENWFEPDSVKRYFDPPKGYTTYESAHETFGISRPTIRKLSRAGEIGTVEKRGRTFFSNCDLGRHFEIPDGYITTIKAAAELHYDLSRINEIARERGIPRIRVGTSTYLPGDLLRRHLNLKIDANSNGSPNKANGNNHSGLDSIMDNAEPKPANTNLHDKTLITLIYDKEAPYKDSPDDLVAAIAKKLKDSQHARREVPLRLIAEVVANFN